MEYIFYYCTSMIVKKICVQADKSYMVLGPNWNTFFFCFTAAALLQSSSERIGEQVLVPW